MSALQQIEAIEAERNYYRDSVAFQRARLFRQGAVTNPRLEELERRLDSAQQRLRVARAVPPLAPQP